MDYKAKQQENAGYHSSVAKKKKSGREEFKKDVEEAVTKGTKKAMKAKQVPKQIYKGKKGESGLSSWSVAELRKLLNQKKKNLLVKSGFPEGKLPRSKVGMIALCRKLKRKRW